MKKNEAKKLADKALEELGTALTAGDGVEFSRYLSAMAKFHDYSIRNVMLIATQCPQATHVAGYHTWKKLGRFVRKCEKGIAIIAPIPIRDHDKCQSPRADKEELIRFRTAHVFDISQTDGDPLPEPQQMFGDPWENTDRLKALIRESGITLTYLTGAAAKESLGEADAKSLGGTILVHDRHAPAYEFHLLAHELAHELLHHCDSPRTLPKSVRETEADAVAFVVAQAIGIEALGATVEYIRQYAGDVETLMNSLDRIRRTATRIITGISIDGREGDSESRAA